MSATIRRWALICLFSFGFVNAFELFSSISFPGLNKKLSSSRTIYQLHCAASVPIEETASSEICKSGLLDRLRRLRDRRIKASEAHSSTELAAATIDERPSSTVEYLNISVGIDLGTTYSAVAVFDVTTRSPVILSADEDRKHHCYGSKNIIPSVVSFQRSSENHSIVPIVGQRARKFLISDPLNTFASVKPFMGKTYADLADDDNCKDGRGHEKNILHDRLYESTAVLPASGNRSPRSNSGIGGDAKIREPVLFTCPNSPHGNGTVSPGQVSAEIIKKLLSCAAEQVKQRCRNANQSRESPESGAAVAVRIDRAVITVPAYFLPAQCRATEAAARLAGIQKVMLIREPEAVALAYGLPQTHPQIVLVFDIGGGTLDISVLEVGNGLVEVITTTGDANLGGDDFNDVIVIWLLGKIQARYGGAVRSLLEANLTARNELLLEAERMKIALSTRAEVASNVRLQISDTRQPDSAAGMIEVACEDVLTQKSFEQMCAPLCSRMLKPLREAALLAGVNLGGETCSQGHNDVSLYGNSAHLSMVTGNDDDDDDNDDTSVETDAPSPDFGGPPVSKTEKLARLSEEQLTDIARNAKTRERFSRRTRNQFKTETKTLHQEKKRLMNELQTSAEKKKASGSLAVGGSSRGIKLHKFPSGQTIHQVILAGGSSRIPMIRKLLSGVLGRDVPIRVTAGKRGKGHAYPYYRIDPDECVAAGAAVMCGVLDGHVQDMSVVSAWQASVYRILTQLSESDFGSQEDEDENDEEGR